MKKILFYLASNSPFYTNLYPSMKRGFEETGYEVIGGSNLLESEELLQEIDKHKPDFVFEMNRVKSEIENFPDDVVHICWLVDFWGRTHDELKGSDILYTWANDWVHHFHKVGIERVYHLPPATDATIYKKETTKKSYDFMFLGHISKDWSEDELNRVIGHRHGEKLIFKDLLVYIKETVLSSSKAMTLPLYLEKKNIVFNTPVDKALTYDINNRAIRHIRRERYIDIFLNISENIALYGSDNWLLHDKYKKFYKGFIYEPNEMNSAMQKSNILLHDGNDPHFRTFDAMAAGVVVAAAEVHDLCVKAWENLGFKDGEHYLSIDTYSDNLDAKKFKDKKFLKKIAKNAQKKVLKEHLWVHRADKIIADVKAYRKESKQKKKHVIFIPCNGKFVAEDFSLQRIGKWLGGVETVKTTLLHMENDNFTLDKNMFDNVIEVYEIADIFKILHNLPHDMIFYKAQMGGYDFAKQLMKNFDNILVNIKNWNFASKDIYNFLFQDNKEYKSIEYIFEHSKQILSPYTKKQAKLWGKEYDVSEDKFIFFPELCNQDSFSKKRDIKYKNIHLVYAGTMTSSVFSKKYFPGNLHLKSIKKLTKQKISVDCILPDYVYDISMISTNLFKDFLHENQINKRFNIIKGTSLKSSVLSKYHFGIFALEMDGINDMLYKYSIDSKFAFYLEGGVPMLVNDKLFSLAKIVKENNLGIVFNNKDIKNLTPLLSISQQEYNKFVNNIEKYRKSFTYDNNKFSSKIISLKSI